MPVVEIVGPAPSTYTRVARMVCEEKKIPYELKQSPPHSPDVDAIHPFGKVPVMRHGDFELCESKAISTYLDLSFPGPKLIPTEPRQARSPSNGYRWSTPRWTARWCARIC